MLIFKYVYYKITKLIFVLQYSYNIVIISLLTNLSYSTKNKCNLNIISFIKTIIIYKYFIYI